MSNEFQFNGRTFELSAAPALSPNAATPSRKNARLHHASFG
jgi:hypothetical protein